jgi:hypothetical protein
VFGYGGGEGDDVVLDLGFDLVDAVNGEGAAIANGVGSGLWDEGEFGERLGGGDLDGEPAAILIFVGPDFAHCGASVTGDHGRSLVAWAKLQQQIPPLRYGMTNKLRYKVTNKLRYRMTNH